MDLVIKSVHSRDSFQCLTCDFYQEPNLNLLPMQYVLEEDNQQIYYLQCCKQRHRYRMLADQIETVMNETAGNNNIPVIPVIAYDKQISRTSQQNILKKQTKVKTKQIRAAVFL